MPDCLPQAECSCKGVLCRTTDVVTAALEGFNFNEAGRLLYEFFWFDFADWYIEIAKASLYSDDSASKLQTQQVLAYVMERSARLWHPYIPFVTETLWQALPHQAESLMMAEWPATGLPRCEVARQQFAVLKDIVAAVRNARSEYNVEVSKKVSAVICITDATLQEAMESQLDSICLLGRIDRDSSKVCTAGLDPLASDVLGTSPAIPSCNVSVL